MEGRNQRETQRAARENHQRHNPSSLLPLCVSSDNVSNKNVNCKNTNEDMVEL